MFLNLIFHISNFHNSKIVNSIFFFIFESDLIFFVQGCTTDLSLYRALSNNTAKFGSPLSHQVS